MSFCPIPGALRLSLYADRALLILVRLEPFSAAIKDRFRAYKTQKEAIDKHEGGLAKFSEGYKTMGFQVDDQGGVRYREWAPNATAARLIGDFSE